MVHDVIGLFLTNPEPRRRALMVADINSTLDGMADKITNLWSEIGLQRVVIRMRKFPDELKNGELVNAKMPKD
jgi:hypothetical protein